MEIGDCSRDQLVIQFSRDQLVIQFSRDQLVIQLGSQPARQANRLTILVIFVCHCNVIVFQRRLQITYDLRVSEPEWGVSSSSAASCSRAMDSGTYS